ncbi:hypothetical protein [Kribbella swartbergensis]
MQHIEARDRSGEGDVLARRNWVAIDAGRSAAERYPEAVAEAGFAFGRL